MIVEVCLGPAPVGLEEAVSAVPRNEHRFHPGSDRAGHLGQRRRADAKVSDLGQVVASQPEPIRVTGVEREHHLEREHHHAANDAPHLAQAGNRVLPVMNGANSHRGVEGLVLERKALRGGSHARRRACGTLRTHERRRFHRGGIAARGRLTSTPTPIRWAQSSWPWSRQASNRTVRSLARTKRSSLVAQRSRMLVNLRRRRAKDRPSGPHHAGLDRDLRDRHRAQDVDGDPRQPLARFRLVALDRRAASADGGPPCWACADHGPAVAGLATKASVPAGS
jgi:hypothetical protein